MKRGLFITFEGPDGSGKTTQIRRFAELLKSRGESVLLTREPGGTPISEKIRNLILDPENTEMEPRCEALLYAASRAQLVSSVIVPALLSGKTVLCDRFMDSSVAYQGFARGLGDGVRIINEFACGDLCPDITFYLKIDPKEGLLRAGKGRQSLDRMEMEKLDFHYRVYEGYNALAEKYAFRYISIDASKSEEEVFSEIIKSYDGYLEKHGL